MLRIRKSWFSYLSCAARFAALLIVINMVACSSSKRTPIGGGTGFDQNTTGDNSDLFTDPTQTNTGPTFDENLFDAELGTDTSNGTNSLNEPTTTEQMCLSQDESLGLDWNTENFGTGMGNQDIPVCYDTPMFTGGGNNQQMAAFFAAFQQGQLPQFMLNAGTASYGLMDTCVQMAAMLPQMMGAQQNADWNMVFDMAQMGLIRCFRAINQWQAQSIPWASPQRNAFGYVDNNLWQMMVIFEDHD